MKLLIIIVVALSLFGCQKEKSTLIDKANGQHFEIGDINGDGKTDTAFVQKTNSKIESYKITFSCTTQSLDNLESQAIAVVPTLDFDNNNANEILIFSQTQQGWWNAVSVLSFCNDTWYILAQNNAFLAEETDFENRIIHKKGSYFLAGHDMWNEDEHGNFSPTFVPIQFPKNYCKTR